MKHLSLPIFLAAALSASACLAGCQNAEYTSVQTETEVFVAETEEVFIPAVPDPDARDKSESVHVEADASGSPKKITVESTLKNPGGRESIRDTTRLADIKNLEGDEEFTREENALIWDNHGKDIVYEGVSTEELPVSLAVHYTLDGEEIAPEKLAGKSGHVTIRFDYDNHTSETVRVKEAEYQVPIPFLAVTAAFLPSDHFSRIEVTNGKVMKLDNQNVVLGVALPGMRSTLRLSAYEPTEEIEIPEFVEFEADVTDFELSFTATLLTNQLLAELEEDDLNDFDDLADGMSELTDALDDLTDGTDKLSDGLKEFRDVLKEYGSGVSGLDEGMQALNQGIATLSEQKGALLTGAESLEKGLGQLNSGLKKFSTPENTKAADEILAIVNELISDGQNLKDELAAAQIGQEELLQLAGAASDIMDEITAAVKEARSELKSVDLDHIEEQMNELARAQVAEALEEALSDLDLEEDQIKAIKKQVKKSIDLGGMTGEAQDLIDMARARLKEIPGLDLSEVDLNAEDVMDTLSHMKKQIQKLAGYSDTFEGWFGQLGEIESAVEGLQEGVSALYKGSQQMSKGIRAFNEGIDQLADGSSQLADGSSQLADAGGQLADGMTEIIDGVDEMADGLREFRDDGAQDLDKLAGDDLQRILNTIRALQKADVRYENYSGILPGKTGEVRFLIETEEIS